MLKYLEEKEAEKLCESTLYSWISSAGYKGCYSAAKTKAAVEEAKLWAGQSQTAKALMEAVESSGKEILVVGMRGGYQCFDSTGTDSLIKVPVVYVDLDGRLTRFVRQPHEVHFRPEDCNGQHVTVEAMDNNIALLHEFGHAKQWIDNDLFFDNHFKEQKGGTSPKNLKIPRKVANSSDPHLYPEGRTEMVDAKIKGDNPLGQSFSQAIQSQAVKVWADKADKGRQIRDPLLNPDGEWLLTVTELEKFQPVTGFGVRIESDNIAKHEWPICDELGISRRENYRDIGGKSTATASQTSTLLKRESAAKQAKAPIATKKLAKICRSCGKPQGSKPSCGNLLHG